MTELFIVSGAIFGYALISNRLANAPITAPMVFTSVGLVFGVGGIGWFDLPVTGEVTSILVETTLVLVLFTDAIRIDLNVLRHESWLPSRLLAVGLPLTIIFGTLVALLLFDDVSWQQAALLAAVLAPTDAALGQAVVSDPRLPVRLRQGLNIESGLNDGIVLPVVTICLALADAEVEGASVSNLLEFGFKQIGFGLGAGLAVGFIGGWLLRRHTLSGAADSLYQQLGTAAIAVGAFSGAELLEGNGFIAAFVAGVAFGQVTREDCRGLEDFTEDLSVLLTAVTFTLFGAVMVGPLLDELTWKVAVYAIASLTIVRMIPVLFAMVHSQTYFQTRVFVGWFGPRGLASILFALVVLEELDGAAAEEIFLVASWTVLISVYAHGLTASPWSGRLGKLLEAGPEDMPEMKPVKTELPTRSVELS